MNEPSLSFTHVMLYTSPLAYCQKVVNCSVIHSFRSAKSIIHMWTGFSLFIERRIWQSLDYVMLTLLVTRYTIIYITQSWWNCYFSFHEFNRKKTSQRFCWYFTNDFKFKDKHVLCLHVNTIVTAVSATLKIDIDPIN